VLSAGTVIYQVSIVFSARYYMYLFSISSALQAMPKQGIKKLSNDGISSSRNCDNLTYFAVASSTKSERL